MNTIYNIGKKVEINPFEQVEYFHLSTTSNSSAVKTLKKVINKEAEPDQVHAAKNNNDYLLVFDIGLLNFTAIIKWYSEVRGAFTFRGETIHFSIENQLLLCW